MLFHERDMFIGDVLDLFFGIFGLIFTESVLLQLLYLLDAVPADITDSDTGLFAFSAGSLDEFPPSFFRQRRHKKPDDISVILGSHTQIGIDDRAFYRLKHILLPGLDGQSAGIHR